MKPSELATCLESIYPTLQPVWLWGPPGVGKSSIVRQAARSIGYDFIDIRAALLDPVDLRGPAAAAQPWGCFPRWFEWHRK